MVTVLALKLCVLVGSCKMICETEALDETQTKNSSAEDEEKPLLIVSKNQF
jgi:hypothetical protein